ncbi:type IX secretion system protein PorD [Flavobacterium luteum]|uniref:DUF4835 family protein n=1 Tax=Flavobacterium luteum TaxID=2026654 RepID=A0A7J5AA26_9FLAO|nr:DUF4835 family protein [Flavobacterium luteum]KAB1154412.1 DUF4835 family protein [Flavobacterium luteum]
MNKIFVFFLLFSVPFVNAQELNCVVKVNFDQVTRTNNQIFGTLEKALSDFINKTNWTGKEYKPYERINCSMVINVTSYDVDKFTSTLQVQSSRAVYNSTYSSPVFNYNDKDFSFTYTEFQNLIFNPANFDSNLLSVIAYYCYMIIGIDADTFALNGGTSSFETAQEITSVAQNGGYKGWSQGDSNQNRFHLLNDIMSNTFSVFREAMFQYHLSGLDTMNADIKGAKSKIKSAIESFSKINSIRPNAFLSRIFFDAKSDEIVSIFSGGPNIPIDDLVTNLNRVSPLNAAKWSEIR